MTAVPVLEAVGLLIRARSLRVQVTPQVAYTVKGPCLLVELREEVAVGMERGGRSTPSSKPPFATDAFDLWTEVVDNTYGWADHLDVNRKDPMDGHPTPWVGRLLRSCAAEAHSRSLVPVVDRIEFKARGWATRIEEMLSGQPDQRAIHGAKCAACNQQSTFEEREGEGRINVPAIIVITYESLRWLACRACGASQPLVDDSTEIVHTSEEAA